MASGDSALSGLRVVECGNMVAAPFCARLLGDAGADVVKVEPPRGDDSRRRGPFPGDTPDPESSGLYLYLNANKRGLILDLKTGRGMKALRDLLAAADILAMNYTTSEVERLRLRRHDLASINPRLIVVSITPFGLTGPLRKYAGDDLIAVASGGLAYATPGVPDMANEPDNEPPLRASTPIAEFLAGIQAAIATVAAVMQRERTGEGCEIDVSQQEAVAMVMSYDIAHASYGEPKRREPAAFRAMPNAYMPCRDGYVVIAGWTPRQWQKLVEVMDNPEWASREEFETPADRSRNWGALEPLLLEWTMARTGEEIAQITQPAGLPCFPAFTVGQMVESEHVKARGYMLTHYDSAGRQVKLPGHAMRMHGTPWELRHPAPKLGEHNEEVHREWLGSYAGEIRPLNGPERLMKPAPEPTVATGSKAPKTALPLSGIRVVDFGQIIAAPFAGQLLAWLGAEVILIETRDRLHTRVAPPFAEGVAGVNRAGGFNLHNANKLGCTLDLSKPEGRELARQLISISDVLIENYSTGAWDRLGLGYQAVRQLRPDIIYLSMAAFGRTGPNRDLVGFHSVINLFSGLAAITGYPSGYPRVLGGVFPDLLSGCYSVLAVVEALHHRSRTGQGQYIELAMTEALTTLLPEAVAKYTMNGQEDQLVGNRDAEKAPHNVYQCRGDQQWVAISVANDDEWRALCAAVGNEAWATDPRFTSPVSRWEHQSELDILIEGWTREHESYEVMHILQNAGVAAAPVLDSVRLLCDPHLVERGFVAWTDHPEAGRRPMGTVSWSIDGTRPYEYRRAPLLGEHNDYVLGDLLQLDQGEIQRLTEAGVVV